MKIPKTGKWKQTNTSDKGGDIYYSKNINLDEKGYLKLSPRMVAAFDDARNSDFGIPLAIGESSAGGFQVATSSNANFSGTIDIVSNTWTEASGANEPTLTPDSHGVWFQGLWHASTDTAVLSRPATGGATQAWTSRITSLSSGKNHFLETFNAKVNLCVANGNTVKAYDDSYSNTATVTIPSDYEVTGLAYNNSKMAIATHMNNDGTEGQDSEARLFIWDGLGTEATKDAGVGSDTIMGVCAYKASFAILTRKGEFLYWNGGGFTKLGSLPIEVVENEWSGRTTNTTQGIIPMKADGDLIYINLQADIINYGRKGFVQIQNFPAGTWCLDPKIGAYHRWSPSISDALAEFIGDASINITTDTLTTSVVTVPETGNILRVTQNDVELVGVTINTDYFIIKVDDNNFKLALTKEKALLGISIDLTGKGTGSIACWFYDLIDYGQTYTTAAGDIGLLGDTTTVYTKIITGARLRNTSLNTKDTISIAVPFLENRGYFITTKIFSSDITDMNEELIVKFRPLKSNDSIIVKQKTRDVEGLPIYSSNKQADWLGQNIFKTTQDLSEAQTLFDNGEDLEVEFIAGAGAGVLVKVSAINSSSGTYSVELEEDVLGASSGLKSEFIIDNWKLLETITSTDNDAGYKSVKPMNAHKWAQFKIELRGSDVTIEELELTKTPHLKSD